MNAVLYIVVALLLAVAIGVQVQYLRAMQNAGAKTTAVFKVIVFGNISLLVLLLIGVLVAGVATGALTGGN